jgi:hypothetical protein
MVEDGFIVCGFDGNAPRGDEWSSLAVPFTLGGVRADAWGLRERDHTVAFGEAKTFDDVDTVHSRRQLEVLGRAKMRGSTAYCRCYIAIPRSAVYELDRVLIDVGLLGAKHLVRIHIPDVLLKDLAYVPREAHRTPA